MAETIQTKQCTKCKQIKQLSEFYKHPKHKNGYRSECKICHLKSTKEYRRSEKGKTAKKHYQKSDKGRVTQKRFSKTEKFKSAVKRYRESEKGKDTFRRFSIRHPKYQKAVKAVNQAIVNSKLPRPDTLLCHYCPKPAQQYHHWHGYEPEHLLDIIAVCRECHIQH